MQRVRRFWLGLVVQSVIIIAASALLCNWIGSGGHVSPALLGALGAMFGLVGFAALSALRLLRGFAQRSRRSFGDQGSRGGRFGGGPGRDPLGDPVPRRPVRPSLHAAAEAPLPED